MRLRTFLFQLILQLFYDLVLNLYHFLLLLLVFAELDEIFLFFLIFLSHLWDFIFKHHFNFVNVFNLPFLSKTISAIIITIYIGAQRIQLTFHFRYFRFQNSIFCSNIIHFIHLWVIFHFHLWNFVLNLAHFFNILPFFIQLFFSFSQLLISHLQLGFQNFIFAGHLRFLLKWSQIII